jgi:F420-non-reducing hydrogenase iron-sulfur subunit
MPRPANPDVLVFLCNNCSDEGAKLPVQWTVAGLHIRLKHIPCSGKIDAQYLLHSLEGGVRGVAVVTCPPGKCTLSQGNYRASIRVKTVQRLLAEIGDDPQRVALIQCPSDVTLDGLKNFIGAALEHFVGKGTVAIDK